jgi:D-inositol-3-phosphate glycosyltransferase
LKNIILGPAFPLRGGIANFNEALCRAFNQEGVSSNLVSFSLQYPGFLFPGTTQFDTGAVPADLKIEALVNSINPFSWVKAAFKIRKEKPDYVIVRYWLPFMAPCLGTIARIVKYKTNIKIIAIADNVLPHEKRMGDAQLTSYFVRSCDAFVLMSRAVMQDLSRFTQTKPMVFIPHPVYAIFGEKVSKSVALDYLKLPKGEKYILFFGFIRKYKGLDLLLEAMAQAKIKALGIKLIIAGEFYEDPSYYNALIEKYQLKDQLILHTNYIDKEAVKYYFCAADLVAQPYHTATQSGVTQIAYHFERPMLVTNVGGLAEIVPDQKVGYVVEKNCEAIADALSDFYENQREASFSAYAAIEKKKFSWENMVEGIQELSSKL